MWNYFHNLISVVMPLTCQRAEQQFDHRSTVFYIQCLSIINKNISFTLVNWESSVPGQNFNTCLIQLLDLYMLSKFRVSKYLPGIFDLCILKRFSWLPVPLSLSFSPCPPEAGGQVHQVAPNQPPPSLRWMWAHLVG